ncbi:hypothetical protein ACJO5Y_00455 [Marinobacter sp. GN3S48]|uniref:hypothetical protein n=1 Tax=Marinobacter sp. GN3S48 TaxID=3382302 RepID=UPI00387B5D8F
MKNHRFFFLLSCLLCLPPVLGGCASYYSHYGLFPAENSEGDPRQVMLNWQTADYPDWWFVADKSTPITVTTQCSTRSWRLADDSHAVAGECADGIRACGQAGLDRVAASGKPADDQTQCLSVNAGEAEARVVDIGASLELLVSCRPAATRRGEGDDQESVDYLRASPVPYMVHIRTSPRGALNGRPPVMDDSVCDAD